MIGSKQNKPNLRKDCNRARLQVVEVETKWAITRTSVRVFLQEGLTPQGKDGTHIKLSGC